MKTQPNYTAIEKYIFDAMDFDGRDINPVTKLEKLQAIHTFFVSEYWYESNKVYFKYNEIKCFANWLMGLPSCLNIDFENYKILEFAPLWGVNINAVTENGKEIKEYNFINSWFNRIAISFYFLLNRETRLSNKPVKEKKAFKSPKISFEIKK